MSNKLELMLRKAGRELADYQVARFFKVPEEMTQTPCDFFGYTAKGQAILIEAKLVKGKNLKIGSSPGLLPHQWCELQDANRAGAISLLVWARPELSLVACLSVKDIFETMSGKHIPWLNIPQYWIRSMIGPCAHYHFLERFLPIPSVASSAKT